MRAICGGFKAVGMFLHFFSCSFSSVFSENITEQQQQNKCVFVQFQRSTINEKCGAINQKPFKCEHTIWLIWNSKAIVIPNLSHTSFQRHVSTSLSLFLLSCKHAECYYQIVRRKKCVLSHLDCCFMNIQC